ncbi:MAG: CHAT domain-containing protein, partial [Planctomycetes bacterium]|nr:CHAT domain-containing protein [Planctomycetota bacterium]
MSTSTAGNAADPQRRDGPIFISHATADDAFVADLRKELEEHRLSVWTDSTKLHGGDKLRPEIALAIAEARQVLVVLSTSTVNSPWVRWEIREALATERRRRGDGYRVIPVLLPGITSGALGTWFDEEPLAVPIPIGPGGLGAAMPALLVALGERLPADPAGSAAPAETEAAPVEDLVLELTDPRIQTQDGARRATATAVLSYQPADRGGRRVESVRFPFTAPLGPIETEDLRWYLESYFLWPIGVFQSRARQIEDRLPRWGQELFKAGLGAAEADGAREALAAWQHANGRHERRFSVLVDSDLPAGAADDAKAAAGEAGTDLLALPWELLHDGRGWLFQGKAGVRVRRRLPNRAPQPTRPTALPIRILLLSPRPERDERGRPIGYIDHRVSARPLVAALEGLGDLARLTVLTPPSYGALDEARRAAGRRGEPFDVVHFDGHGVYNRRLGLGGLCFEEPPDASRPAGRTMDFVDAARLAGLFRAHRIPLVFLEACQTAVAEGDPTASVAASLLNEGVASVVAMSRSVLVETARRFVDAFYSDLAHGARVGQAMLAGQRALFNDPKRGKVMGVGELRLQDWFVPVLFQDEADPQVIARIPAEEVQRLSAEKRRHSLGELPDPPPHEFAGRSRELLALERRLHDNAWAVVRGTGGAGKTTLAVELARWLARTGRCERVAFVSLEAYQDVRGVLDSIGRQLLPKGENYSVAQFDDPRAALLPVERALRDHATLVVVDNCECVLPGPAAGADAAAPVPADAGPAREILALCRRLLDAGPATRLVFTSREALPAPFDAGAAESELGALGREDAVELVGRVLARAGLAPASADPGCTPQEITD